MPHVVKQFKNTEFEDAIHLLRKAHQFLVSRAQATIIASDFDKSKWGCSVKRSIVKLHGGDNPKLIGKIEEKFVEVVNIIATVERLIDAIEWFAGQPQNKGYSILECHPSTSDDTGGNDLIIIDTANRISVRCEVCDVVSSNAGSNKKEEKDIRNLGCNELVPQDGVKRYICTSREFAMALTNSKRKWAVKPYRYKLIETGGSSETCMLLIQSAYKK
jgi:hypothetical protein